MAINKENLTFKKVVFQDVTYFVLDPQNLEEFIYGYEHDILTIGENTKIETYNDVITFFVGLN
jgi:hypothetical protein